MYIYTYIHGRKKGRKKKGGRKKEGRKMMEEGRRGDGSTDERKEVRKKKNEGRTEGR